MALVFTVPMVQVFFNSNGGVAGYDKMPIVLADGIASLAGGAYPLFAPLVGGFGSFVAVSNTISNMMFSLFQFEVGIRIGVDASWMVALQAVGGAAGNVICVHNVVAALVVVGLTGMEGCYPKKAARVCLLRVDGRGDRLRRDQTWSARTGLIRLANRLAIQAAEFGKTEPEQPFRCQDCNESVRYSHNQRGQPSN